MATKKLVEITDQQDTDEQEDVSIMTLKGVGPATYEKLQSNGYETVESIAAANPKVLSGKCDLTDKFARGLVKNAREVLNMSDFRTFQEFSNHAISRIPLGLHSLDLVFEGGIPSGMITELYGESGTGKTQMCISSTVEAIRRGKLVAYIDTKNTLTPLRLQQICQEREIDASEVMARIVYFPVMNTSQMNLALETIRIHRMRKEIGLIVVDSATAFYRTEYLGRGQLSERQQVLNHFLSELKSVGVQCGASILITNLVMDRPDVMFGDPVKPIGGHVVAHSSAYRLFLKKAKAGTQRVIIKCAPDIPECEFIFKVVRGGLEDAD